MHGGPMMARALAGLLIAALFLAGWQFFRAERSISSHAQTKADFSDYRAAQAEKLARAVENIRAHEAEARKKLQEAQDAEYLARIAAQGDAGRARAAADRLRKHAANLATADRCRAGGLATAASSTPASAPSDLLADMLSRIDAAAGEISSYADRARIAGQLCERSYDSLIGP